MGFDKNRVWEVYEFVKNYEFEQFILDIWLFFFKVIEFWKIFYDQFSSQDFVR